MSKKLMKVILVGLLLVPLVAGLFGSDIGGFAEGPPSGKAFVTIHKKKMTTKLESIQNTGNIMSEFSQYDGLEDVAYTVYNVSAEFYALLKTINSSTDKYYTRTEAIAEMQKIVPITEDNRLVATEITNANGEFTMTLDKKIATEEGGKDAIYLFVETPKPGVTIAENMVLAFPVYQLDSEDNYTDNELSHIHLYPKNVVSTAGRLTILKKGTAQEAGLDGAQFILQKIMDKEPYIVTGVNNGLYTWSKRFVDAGEEGVKENESASIFESGKEYSVKTNPDTGVFKIYDEGSATNGQLVINNLESGNYTLVEIKAPDNAGLINDYIETDFSIPIDGTTPLYIMNDTIIVDKTIDQQDHSIGDLIDYTMSFRIPDGIQDVLENGKKRYDKVELKDTHDSFLTFINDSATVTLMSGEDTIPVTEGNVDNYKIITADNGFTLNLTEAGISQLTPGATLTFSYKMQLNSTATPDDGYKNNADVVVSGDTDILEGKDEETGYTGGKRFVKIDADLAEPDNKLAGAEFVVRDLNNENANYWGINPETKKNGWVSEYENAVKFKTDSDGIIDITGLAYGTYYLEETVAPEGYVLLKDRIEFEVKEASYKELDSLSEELNAPTEVVNRHKGTLPSTGGMGIVALLMFGVAAFGIAGWYFKRNGKAEV